MGGELLLAQSRLPPAFINSNIARALQSVASSPVAADGTFRLVGVPPGEYRVSVGTGIRVPSGYVKTVRFGDTDALNAPLRIERQSEDGVEIVLGTRAGTITGRAPSAATVVLVPDINREYRTDLFRTASTDADGQFRLDAIPPGDYKVFAWRQVEAGAWQDPAFLAPLESHGKPVHIEEGTNLSLEIAAIDG